MVNSRLIRTLVSLCLIAAIVIQPIAISAAQTSCTAAKRAKSTSATDAQHRCEGCGHCEVSSVGELCGCCSDGHTNAGQPSCCGNNTTNESNQSEPDPIFGELSKLVPEPGVPESESDGSAWTARTDTPSLARVCMCSLRSQPGTPTSPRAPVNEEADTQSLAFGCTPSFDHQRNAETYLRHRFEDTQSNLLLDYQCHLCVWRL